MNQTSSVHIVLLFISKRHRTKLEDSKFKFLSLLQRKKYFTQAYKLFNKCIV